MQHACFLEILNKKGSYEICRPCDKRFPVNTAWRVLRLRMEERPPNMNGSCEYIE